MAISEGENCDVKTGIKKMKKPTELLESLELQRT